MVKGIMLDNEVTNLNVEVKKEVLKKVKKKCIDKEIQLKEGVNLAFEDWVKQ